jgi:signal transduction histidine kinase
VRRERASLRSVVDADRRRRGPRSTPSNISLTRRLPEEPLMLDADALRISQVLANLLTNAAK